MSYCPRPDKTTKTNLSAAGTKSVDAPAARTEACNDAQSTVVSGGGSTSSHTTVVTGPSGPAGPAGADGKDGISIKWNGEFALNTAYKAMDPVAYRFYDVVSYNGSTYIAIRDNTSTTEGSPEYPPDTSPTFWSLLSAKGVGVDPPTKDFIDQLKSDVFDWIKNASITDLLLAGLGVAGVVWAGSKIISAITGSGHGDGNADSRFTGSPGYVTTSFVPPTLKSILISLCGIEGTVYDVSALSDTDICTFTIGSVTSIREVINQLSLAYQFEMVDTGGVLKFVPRSASPVRTIDVSDMGIGTNSSQQAPPAFQAKRYQGIDLPKQVNLQYYSEDIDYNVMTQTADLDIYEEGQIINLQVPVTLTHEKAKQICEVTLINAWLEAKNFAWTLNYKHIDLEPGDVVNLGPVGLTRITKLSEDNEGILSFEGVDAGAAEAMSASNLNVTLPQVSTNVPAVIGYSQGLYIDPPNINDQDTGVRIMVAVNGFDAANYPGFDVYCSIDGGATSFIAASGFVESTLGLVASVTAAHDYHTIDNDTVISVQLKTNSLTSTDEISMMNGKNLCMVGQEMIGFKTATLTAPGVYALSGLLRGRQGTEQYIGTHQANELFVILDESIVSIPWTNADRFTTKKYKVVTKGSSPDKVDWEDVYMVSNNVLMWTILNPKVVKTGTDFTYTWDQRVRYNNSLSDLVTTNNDSDFGGYGIIIYAADGIATKRTATMTSPTFVYTTAMQIADFGVAQTHVKAAVAQMSTIYGSGYPTIVSI